MEMLTNFQTNLKKSEEIYDFILIQVKEGSKPRFFFYMTLIFC